MTRIRASLFTILTSTLLIACSDDGTAGQTGGASTGGTGETSASTAASITLSSSISVSASDGETDSASTGDPTTDTASTTANTSDPTTDGTSGGDPVTATIYEIQTAAIAPGTNVLVEGVIVTGVSDGIGMYVQESDGGESSGIYVGTGDIDLSGLAVGDVVDVSGTVLEPDMGALADLTQIDASGAIGGVVDTGDDLAATPETVALSILGDPVAAEVWEGVLVTVDEAADVTVSAENDFDEFAVSDGADSVLVDEMMFNVYDDAGNFPTMGLGATFQSVTGPLNYSFAEFKVAPRTAADLVGYNPPNLEGVDVDTLSAGDLVVTEIMYDPDVCFDQDCEYVEIYNAAGTAVNLNGLIVEDAGGATATVSEDAVLQAGGYAIIGQTPWGYSTVTPLVEMEIPAYNNNSTDRVIISNSGGMLDETATYTPSVVISDDDGYAWKLDVAPDATTNDVVGNWCYSANNFEGTDFGSPGAVNMAGCTDI